MPLEGGGRAALGGGGQEPGREVGQEPGRKGDLDPPTGATAAEAPVASLLTLISQSLTITGPGLATSQEG